MRLKVSSAKRRPFCIGLNVLTVFNVHTIAFHGSDYQQHDPSWWRNQMETFSALLVICEGNSPTPGEFPGQRPVTRRFDVLFDLRPNKRLSKQWWGWWFETLPNPLWRHCNDMRTFRNHLPSACMVRKMFFHIIPAAWAMRVRVWGPIQYLIKSKSGAPRKLPSVVLNNWLRGSGQSNTEYRWVSARKTWLKCVSNEDTSILH